MASPSSAWYNDAEYSDLTLKLSDGREIKPHKVIVCKQNEYFCKLCGATSSFREAKESVITLKEDDADAVEEILRKIYGCALPAAGRREWRFWFTLIITADKYLEPALSAKADQHFREVALGISDADVIFDIIQTIKIDMSHVEPLLAFADMLRKKNLKKLLKNERYREFLIEDKDLMLAQLDEIEKMLDVPQMKNKLAYSLCTAHADQVFRSPGTPFTCPLCPIHRFGPFGQPRTIVQGVAEMVPTTGPSW